VLTSHPATDRAALFEACRLAVAFGQCGLVRLRHAAPVGHGFGVPSPHEVAQAWQRSRDGMAKRGAALPDDGFPLPGLPSLFSAIAGVELVPRTPWRRLAAALRSSTPSSTRPAPSAGPSPPDLHPPADTPADRPRS
jgi:hypothetical protein